MSIDTANPKRSSARQPPCARGMHSHQSGSPQSPEKKGWHLACSIPFSSNPRSQLGIPESKSPPRTCNEDLRLSSRRTRAAWAANNLSEISGLEVSARADSLRVPLQIGAVKKHHLRLNLLRPSNCTVEVNSSYELYESDL